MSETEVTTKKKAVKEAVPTVETHPDVILAQTLEKTEVEKSGNYMYMGPSLKDTWLPEGKVFVGGIPKFVYGLVDKYPYILKLFIPIEDIVQADKDLKTPGKPLWVYYQRTLKGAK